MKSKMYPITRCHLTDMVNLISAEITVSVEDDRAFTDDAKVMTTDVEVDNGVFHIIDQIMMPGA